MTAASVAANHTINNASSSAATTAAPKRGTTTRLPLISGMAGKTP